MLSEGIDTTLAQIFKEFDRHAQITNTKYSIDADYPDFQGYTVLKSPDFDGFLRHITNYVKDYPIYMTVNGIHFNYNYLNDRGFKLPKRKTNLLTFSITPIQENTMKKDESDPDPMGEDQLKSPTKSMRHKQNGRNRSKYNPGKTAFENINFEDRLEEALKEEVGFVNPDVLFTKPFGLTEPTMDPFETIRGTRPAIQQQLHDYLMALENAPETVAPEIEDLIGGCNRMLSSIDRITGGFDGPHSTSPE